MVFHGGTFPPLPINGDGEISHRPLSAATLARVWPTARTRPKERQLDLACFKLKHITHPLESNTNSDITWPLDESLLRND